MLDTNQMSLFPQRTTAELIEDIEKLTSEIQKLYSLDEIPWCLGWSGGKDSSAVLQLVWNAIAKLPPESRHKTIYVMTTDTLVENPIVSAWVRQSLKHMKTASRQQNLPIEPHLLFPEVKNTFWVSLIGKGYPSPRHGFRWCTERLKIHPSNQFVRDVVRESGEVIVVLGTRKTESIRRSASMEKHEASHVSERIKPQYSSFRSLLYYSHSLPNALIYSPIQNWRTDEVWLYLMQWENPWGNDNKDLFAMYRGATEDNECPLVIDTSTPSCGDSRFGCWVCTLVNQDKSMAAMIQNDEEKEWMQPLLDIRNELDIKDDRDKRDFRRIYGKVELFERNLNGETSIEPIPGPYKKEWREYWLRRVLEAQTQIRRTAPPDMRDITLITPEELSEIRRIWLEEKHEFDDSLPRIYEEVTGERFVDSRPGAAKTLLGIDEWELLEEICEGDEMHIELMAKLLSTERQYYTMTRRVGFYDALEKCFDTSARSQDEAIENAHYKRNIKEATGEADVNSIKQLTLDYDDSELPKKEPDTQSWGSLKFPVSNTDDEDEFDTTDS